MTEIKEGQIWQEVDPRFCRKVEVTKIDGDLISIRNIDGFKRSTRANRKRFNGKRSGYKLVSE